MLSLRKIHTEEGIPSSLAPSLLVAFYDTENTLALFFVKCPPPQGIIFPDSIYIMNLKIAIFNNRINLLLET